MISGFLDHCFNKPIPTPCQGQGPWQGPGKATMSVKDTFPNAGSQGRMYESNQEIVVLGKLTRRQLPPTEQPFLVSRRDVAHGSLWVDSYPGSVPGKGINYENGTTNADAGIHKFNKK